MTRSVEVIFLFLIECHLVAPGVHGAHEIAPAASLRAACYLRIRPRPKTKAGTQHNALTVLGMSAEAQMGD